MKLGPRFVPCSPGDEVPRLSNHARSNGLVGAGLIRRRFVARSLMAGRGRVGKLSPFLRAVHLNLIRRFARPALGYICKDHNVIGSGLTRIFDVIGGDVGNPDFIVGGDALIVQLHLQTIVAREGVIRYIYSDLSGRSEDDIEEVPRVIGVRGIRRAEAERAVSLACGVVVFFFIRGFKEGDGANDDG